MFYVNFVGVYLNMWLVGSWFGVFVMSGCLLWWLIFECGLGGDGYEVVVGGLCFDEGFYWDLFVVVCGGIVVVEVNNVVFGIDIGYYYGVVRLWVVGIVGFFDGLVLDYFGVDVDDYGVFVV